MCQRRVICQKICFYLLFLYFTSNFDILPYKSYPNNDMGCKSRPKLGCSQFAPDYATGRYLLTLVRITKSGTQFQNFFRNLNATKCRFLHQLFCILHLLFLVCQRKLAFAETLESCQQPWTNQTTDQTDYTTDQTN